MYRKANLIISVLTAMSWLTDVSLSGTDKLIVGIFLVNLVLAILLAAGICLAGYTLAIYNEV